MRLFAEKVKVFEAKGQKNQYKEVKKALRERGIRCYGSVWQDEPPVCGCGAKLDNRDFGPNGRIDRDIYTIRVRKEDEAAAGSIVKSLLPDYKPYVKRENQLHF